MVIFDTDRGFLERCMVEWRHKHKIFTNHKENSYGREKGTEHINKKFGVKVELIHREQNIEQTFERTL